MSIINEQNILGNPELADANRPGSDVTIADYSFGTMSNVYEKILHEAMGLARGGNWTQPTPYSGEVDHAEVEKESGIHEKIQVTRLLKQCSTWLRIFLLDQPFK